MAEACDWLWGVASTIHPIGPSAVSSSCTSAGVSFRMSTGNVKVSLEGPRTPEYSGVRVTVPPAPP